MRDHLRRRYKLFSRAHAFKRFPSKRVYEFSGVYEVPVTLVGRGACLCVNDIGKPCTGKLYARFDEGGLALPALYSTLLFLQYHGEY